MIGIFLFSFCFYSLAGFSPLIVSSCNETDGDIRVIHLNNTVDLDAFLNPIALLLCYYVLAISSRFILNAKVIISSYFPCNNDKNHQLIIIITMLPIMLVTIAHESIVLK